MHANPAQRRIKRERERREGGRLFVRTGKRVTLSDGRNETQIRREDDVLPVGTRLAGEISISICRRSLLRRVARARISKCLEFIKTFMIPEVTAKGRAYFNVNAIAAASIRQRWS